MCGIAGVMRISDQAREIDLARLDRVRDHMRRRGPDGAGTWLSADAQVALAHRRLAIIDLSERGAQPMHLGPLSITFNGEIYNYRALRQSLEQQGETFVSDSDTEVILRLYAREGVGMLRKLRGMYAFGLWDSQARELLLARDPLGIKPLYYAETDGQLWFSSQARALADTGAVSAEPDIRGWNQFLLWGSVPEPRTVYRQIANLPAGHFLSVQAGQPAAAPQPHYDLARVWASTGARAALEDVREAASDSVRHHLVADVPVGIFLSAGIDSGAVMGLASESGSVPQSLTLTFSEFAGQSRDESPVAAAVASEYQSQHHCRSVSQQEFEQDLPLILDAMDLPSIDGVNTWFVSKAARELGWKVALSGLGGDELFGGYPSFRSVPAWNHWLAWTRRVPRLGEAAGRIVGRLAVHPKAQGMLRFGGSWAGAYFMRRGLFMPAEVERHRPSWLPFDPEAIGESLSDLERLLEADPGSDHARVGLMETAGYMRNQLLRDSDWASMAHSVELRVPLVDSVLFQRLAHRMPAAVPGQAKVALALAPSKPLPAVVLSRPKSGFTTPLGSWVASQAASRREPWARSWALRVSQNWREAATRGGEMRAPTVRGKSRRPESTRSDASRLRVVHLQRYPIRGFHSVERLFDDVRTELEGSDIDIRVRINAHPSRGLWPRLADVVGARFDQGAINHVTGDVHYLCWGLDPKRTILTVLDCGSLKRLTGWRRRVMRQLWYKGPLRRCAVITVISDFTRRELVELTGCDERRIRVVHPHLSAEFQRVDRPFRQERPRILQVGAAPNKNIERLAAALQGIEADLVVIGQLKPSQREAIAAAGLSVIERVGLGRDEVLREYIEADAIAFVSTYEGFGLPIIEGQAIGRPVITSSVCSMPEVARDAACIVDPHDTASIREGLMRVLHEPGYRESLVAKGFENVERFRLKRIAGQYAAIYRELADSLGARPQMLGIPTPTRGDPS